MEKAGSVEADKKLSLVEADKNLSKSSFLKECVLPPKVLLQLSGMGFLTGNVYGFIYYQSHHHVPGGSWRTLLRHSLQFGQQVGSKTALWPVMVASVEHGMDILRGKRDPLNSFIGGASLGGYITYSYRCGAVKGAVSSLGLGSLYGLAEFLTAPAPNSATTL